MALAAPIFLLPGGHDLGSGRLEPSVGVARSLVEDYAHAIEVNHLELALSYVHPSSPERAEIASALREQLASHLERARTTHLECHRRPDGTLSATVNQELVRVFEMKFTRATRRSIYHFREHRGKWRIWGIDEVAPSTPWRARTDRYDSPAPSIQLVHPGGGLHGTPIPVGSRARHRATPG